MRSTKAEDTARMPVEVSTAAGAKGSENDIRRRLTRRKINAESQARPARMRATPYSGMAKTCANKSSPSESNSEAAATSARQGASHSFQSSSQGRNPSHREPRTLHPYCPYDPYAVHR